MNTMPQRIISMIDAIMMTFVAFYVALSGLPVVSFIGYITATLAMLYWINRVKMQIERNHEGSLKKWFVYFFKNWKI